MINTKPHTSQPTALPHLQQLIENGVPHFGVFDRVETINYLDYHSYLLSGKAVSQWRKKLRANQFCFIQIVQPPYRLCFAVATLNWVTSSFCYLYNDADNSLELVEAIKPLTQNTVFNQSTYQDSIHFHSKKLTIDLLFATHKVHDSLSIQLKSKFKNHTVSLQAKLLRTHAPLSVCSATGKTGWTYTQKETINQITGQMLLSPNSARQNNKKQHNKKQHNITQTIELSHAVASLDWSLGYMRRVTNWFWSCISAYLDNGKHFGLNLAKGVNETGTSENACWVEGKRYHLPAVLFKRGSNEQEDWHIYHQSLSWSKVQIELTFTPIKCYKKSDRLMIVDSIFEQWIGYYSGMIVLDDQTITLNKVMGLAEDHYAKW